MEPIKKVELEDVYTVYKQVKVTDFGLTRKVDATVKYLEYVNNYHAPELCETVVNEVLTVNKSTDIWALDSISPISSLSAVKISEYRQLLDLITHSLLCDSPAETPVDVYFLFGFKVRDNWLRSYCAHNIRVIFYYCLKGRFPWQKASIMCKPYWEWEQWLKEKILHFLRDGLCLPDVGKDDGKKKSTLQHWISTTLSTMAEISEQVVSARDD
uniref:Protein kinase domain-containing protein n=1 Tax=Heterorhabditis bacteriophora TaxID=37862 RepID=A0A1I7WNK8_HETBA